MVGMFHCHYQKLKGMEGHLQKFYMYGYLNKRTSLSLCTTTLNNQQGLPQPHQNANLNMLISLNGFERIFLKHKDITKAQVPFGYHKKNECLIRSLLSHIMQCILGCQKVHINGSQCSHNRPTLYMLVQVTIHQWKIILSKIGNPSQQWEKSSPTKQMKGKWVSKKHIQLPNDSELLATTSTSHSLNDLSTPIPSVSPQPISQVANTLNNTSLCLQNIFWLVLIHQSITKKHHQLEQSLGRGRRFLSTSLQ